MSSVSSERFGLDRSPGLGLVGGVLLAAAGVGALPTALAVPVADRMPLAIRAPMVPYFVSLLVAPRCYGDCSNQDYYVKVQNSLRPDCSGCTGTIRLRKAILGVFEPYPVRTSPGTPGRAWTTS